MLDVDGPPGEPPLVALERRSGPLPDLYCQQWTGGERHGRRAAWAAIPKADGVRDAALVNSGQSSRPEARAAAKMTTPSLHPSGRRQKSAEDRKPKQAPPEPAPAWLIDLLDPPEVPRSDFSCRREKGDDRYVEKALTTELKLTARAPEGEHEASCCNPPSPCCASSPMAACRSPP